MSNISYSDYWAEIRSLAESMVSEEMNNCHGDREAAEESINDSVLHETIDGHQWVIYYSYNNDVLRHSENADYYEDNFGADDLAATLKERGFDGLKTVMAYFAMYADVANRLEQAFDDYEAEHPEQEESES